MAVNVNCIKMNKVNKVTPSQIRAGKADFPLIIPLAAQPIVTSPKKKTGDFPKKFTEEELRGRLTQEQYNSTQKAGTEKAYTGEYYNNHREGIYNCVVCQEKLFLSDKKYDSGSGWPSFSDVVSKDKVKLVADNTMMMARTEVVCAQCGAHLGHVFDDGPKETGKRYCVNSSSLCFNEKK